MVDLIEEIKNQNLKLYGAKVLQEDMPYYFRIITEKVYSDRTHFVYELLQNAEDACERKRKSTGEKDFKICFKLSKENLEVRHNGIIFQDSDIKRICDIEEKDIEEEDIIQIGKFGIGFKSVYAYTQSPKIYSGDNSFYIKNLVLPYRVERRTDLTDGETLFFIPFNHKEITPEEAYEKIGYRLKNFGMRTLLFLRNISEISWEMDGVSGKYLRTCEFKDGYRWVALHKDDKIDEKWLVFEKQIQADDNGRLMEVAYLVKEDVDKNTTNIVKAENTKLVTYFPTEKETHLHFLIQAPFNTTATRENILNDNWNKTLISEISDFVAESITKVKSLKLLDVDFLNTLPIEIEYFSEETNLVRPIYDKVKEKLSSEEELLPTSDNEFVSAKKALLARGSDLRNLLLSEQLNILFDRTHWLDESITKNKADSLRKYLVDELKILKIGPKRFAEAIDRKFIEQQTDKWLSKFYEFLVDQRALWRKEYYSQPDGILRSKPIIRLEDGKNVAPFDKDGKPLAYLPPSNEKTAKSIKRPFPTVKIDSISSDAIKFLKDLGLTEPDAVDIVLKYIFPKYRPWKKGWERGNEKDLNHLDLEDNLHDVKWIVKAVKKSKSHPRKDELISNLRQTEFLYCQNMAYYCQNMANGGEYWGYYSSFSEDVIYVGSTDIENKDIETFFEGNDEIWLLDERYKDVVDIETLKLLGCKDKIEVSFRQPKWNDYVIISDSHSRHERGLDGFDPDCEIEGLEFALENINIEKSKIIWKLLKKHYGKISGTIEKATRQDYSNKEEQKHKFSKMGKLLTNSKWVYGNKEAPQLHLPSEILLSEISEEYDNFPEKQIIGEKLGFKTPIIKEIEKIKGNMSKEIQDKLDLVVDIEKCGLEDEIKKLIRKNKESKKSDDSTQKSLSEIASELKNFFTAPIGEHMEPAESDIIVNLTPDEEEKIQKIYREKISTILKNLKLLTLVKAKTGTTIKGAIDTSQFLLEQYTGHCQICNVRLFSGNKKSSRGGLEFVTTRLIEIRNKNPYANMEWNVLCLCPNHFALFKYGIKDLRGIWELVESVSKEEVAAEWVEERKGDYYIAKIKMMGESDKIEETELFYSQTHIRKIAALIEARDKTQDS